MHPVKKFLPSIFFLASAGAAFAAPTADEIKQLGTTLTPWGAEVAGNKEGTIPAYTGGLTKPPANYDKKRPGWRPDPFPNEKPLYRIDAKNAAQYKDKLTPGTLALIQKYPATFFVDVYPTHRTAAYPKEWLDNSIKNATRCALISDGDGVDTSKGCGGGVLFPIPKNGLEVMWNKASTYKGAGILKRDAVIEYVKPNGEVVSTATADILSAFPISDPATEIKDIVYLNRVEYKGPTRLAGSSSLFYDSTQTGERRAYSYQPSTRRVRMAPDFAADTPISQMGGAALYDDDTLFVGKRERYNWKLIGKKEVYLPYNNYRMSFPDPKGGCTPKEYLTPSHPKSDCMRWELHRVWHVQATLKDGKRHVYHKRDLFLDEDSLAAGLAENYDQSGRLYRYNEAAAIPMYEARIPGFTELVNIDLISGVYVVNRTDTGIMSYTLMPAMLAPDSATNKMLK
ncbi:DUF1329 domain-containing protein [Massilia cavernae]|nr:DUF1329 domain-containing protein [Massilia cavernae]